MMFLEYWTSSRSSLCSLLSSDDIPNIRVKLANEMFFNPRNTGNKNPVITFDHDEVYLCIFFSLLCSFLVKLFIMYIFFQDGGYQ